MALNGQRVIVNLRIGDGEPEDVPGKIVNYPSEGDCAIVWIDGRPEASTVHKSRVRLKRKGRL